MHSPMTHLRRFWTTFDVFLRKAFGKPVDTTAFTRFVYFRSHLKDPYNGFMPPRAGGLSVCQVLGRSTSALWRLGRRARAEHSLRGRLDFSSNALPLVSPNLHLVVDHRGYRGHANVVGWPGEKAKQMQVAKLLARRAQVLPVDAD